MNRGMSNNSISDLKPLVVKILEDKGWHCMTDILKDVGDTIMPERAVRFYQGQGNGASGAEKEGGDPRPLDERIRAGRRRGVYLALKAMINSGMVECRNNIVATDDREYKLVESFVPKRRGGPLPRSSVSKVAGVSLVSLVDDLQQLFSERFPKSRDNADLDFHCRHLKRIILLNFLETESKTEAEAEPEVGSESAVVEPVKE